MWRGYDTGMQMYVFRSRSAKDVVAFSHDKSGANIAPELGLWTFSYSMEISAGNSIAGVGRAHFIMAEIDRRGFLVAPVTVCVSHIAIAPRMP